MYFRKLFRKPFVLLNYLSQLCLHMSRINLIIPFSLVESKYMSPRLHMNDLWPLGEYSRSIS